MSDIFSKPTPEKPLYIALIHQQRRRIIMFKAIGVDEVGYQLTVAPSVEYGGTSRQSKHIRNGVGVITSFDRQGLADQVIQHLSSDCREYVVQTFYDGTVPVTVSIFKGGKFIRQ